jgi:hypothetical protein
MRAGGEFGHHATEGGMQIELAENHIGQDFAAESAKRRTTAAAVSSQLVSIPRISMLRWSCLSLRISEVWRDACAPAASSRQTIERGLANTHTRLMLRSRDDPGTCLSVTTDRMTCK